MASPINATISERVRTFRKAAGMTMEELGARLDPPVTQQMLSRYETNGTRWAADTLMQIAAILNVELLQLLGMEDVDTLSNPEAYDRLIFSMKLEKIPTHMRERVFKILDIIMEE